MREAASQGWTTGALERQISTLYYERLLTSSDRPAVETEATGEIAPLQTPREFVRDPVMLEFLGLPAAGKLLEADLEHCPARQSARVPARTQQRIRVRGKTVPDQHRVQRLLHRPGLLQLPA